MSSLPLRVSSCGTGASSSGGSGVTGAGTVGASSVAPAPSVLAPRRRNSGAGAPSGCDDLVGDLVGWDMENDPPHNQMMCLGVGRSWVLAGPAEITGPKV